MGTVLPVFSTLSVSSHPVFPAVSVLELNRPEVHNAFNEPLIQALHEAITFLGQESGVRAIVLRGAGSSFCAGADLNWMRRMVDASLEDNQTDALRLADMLKAIKHCPKPVVARVHGAAYGGGVGLVAACDIALAETATRFCLSEVRLGLIPAVIAPFVQPRLGEGMMRALTLTASPFSAELACQHGLLYQVVKGHEALDVALDDVLHRLLNNAPVAMASAKRLLDKVSVSNEEDIRVWTSAQIAALRVSEEGQEGMRAFLDKRPPKWQ